MIMRDLTEIAGAMIIRAHRLLPEAEECATKEELDFTKSRNSLPGWKKMIGSMKISLCWWADYPSWVEFADSNYKK